MANEDSAGQNEIHRPVRAITGVVLGVAAMGVLSLFAIRCELGPDVARAYPSRTLPSEPDPVLLPPPPMDEEYFPCSDCHKGAVPNRTRREFEDEHEEFDLAHGDLWCLSCHAVEDYGRLHLSDGTAVDFEESWRLCTECHGKKLADWRAGVHGKRTGHWWGPKEYRNCVECHDPHSPSWKPIAPEPVPTPPAEIGFRRRMPAKEVPSEAE